MSVSICQLFDPSRPLSELKFNGHLVSFFEINNKFTGKQPTNATGLLPIFVAFNVLKTKPENPPPDFPPSKSYDTSKEEEDFK